MKAVDQHFHVVLSVFLQHVIWVFSQNAYTTREKEDARSPAIIVKMPLKAITVLDYFFCGTIFIFLSQH